MKATGAKTPMWRAACLSLSIPATALATAYGSSSGVSCPSGTWPTLEACISAKNEAGVDDECNCFLSSNDQWQMEPDN